MIQQKYKGRNIVGRYHDLGHVYVRRCKRCDGLFKTKHKKATFCDVCTKSKKKYGNVLVVKGDWK
jgi:hypothetical protein